MALLTEKGTFTKRNGTGSQTVTLANSSLTPKVLWLWTNAQTANGSYGENYLYSYGFSDGTNDAVIAAAAEDNSAAADNATVIRNDAVCVIFSPGATTSTVAAQADVTSFGAGQFVLNWSVAGATANVIHYMVAGGSDITNVAVVSRNVGSTALGTIDYTDVGFQGDFVNLIGCCATGATVNSTRATVCGMVSAATSSSAQWVIAHMSENATTSDTYNYKENDEFITELSETNANLSALADFSGFLSNGISINVTNQFSNVASPIAYLVIKGGVWNVGGGTAPATATTQTINTTSSSTPAAVMMFTWGDTTVASAAAAEAQNRFSIGGADASLNEGCISNHDLSAQANMVNTTVSLDTKIIRAHTANATAASSTTLAEADITTMTNDGNFVITWSTTLSGMGYSWFCLSAGVSTTPVSETSIHKYNLAAYIAQTNIHKYNMIGNIAQTNIHKYHVLNNIAQTNIHKYNLLQNVLQSNIHKYNLAAYIAQTSIQKYNLLAYILQSNIHKYDILNFITPATSIHKYNLFKNIAQTSIHKYNLLQNALQTSIQKYNLIAFIAQTNIHKYNLSAYIAQNSIQKYNILAYILQNSIHKYDIISLAFVLATSIQKYNLFAYIAQTSIHKYNLAAYIAQTSIHKYNLLQNALSTTIHKYNLLQNALATSIHKYNLLKNVLQTNIHKYNMLQNILQDSIHKYNVLQNILQSSIHKYDILVLGAVVNALIAKYNILQYVTQPNIHKYNILKDVLQSTIHKYNLLVNTVANSIQKYNVLQNILQNSLHKYALLQNVVQSSIHKYDILVEAATVLVNSIHKYNVLQNILQTSKHKYDVLNTISRTSIHKYNLLQNAIQSSIHKYVMGGRVSQFSRHVYNLQRDVFSTFMGGIPLQRIRYPVYHVSEGELFRRRKILRETVKPVILPAFMQNINRTLAPFVITNPQKHTISVKFAANRPQNVHFRGKSVPIQVASKTNKKQLHKARCASFVMNQKAIEKYGSRLNKVSKLLKLLLLAENNPFKQ